MDRDTNTCPYCGSMEKTLKWSERSLVFRMPSYDSQGNIVATNDPNVTRKYYTCNKCGAPFSCQN